MRLVGLFVNLIAVSLLAACAAGSGRQGTQIVVSGTGPTGQIQGGTDTVFVMTVTNTGPYDASNVKLIDNVGNQLKLLSITCTAKGGATCPASPTVEMTIPTIPNGGSLIFSVNVQLDTGATGTVQNTLSASFAEELDPTADSASVTATAFSVVTDVVVSGTGPTNTLVGGSTAVFVMTVTNNGPDAATSFNVYDNVGNGLSLNSITCTASGGAVCPTTVGVLTAVDTLPSGGVLTFNVTTTVGQNVNGTVSNQIVADVKTNSTPGTNTFYATATVVTADLVVSGSAPAGPLLSGASGAFTMVVTNNGPGSAANINITNALSSGITASGLITCVASGGATCPAAFATTTTVASMPVSGVLTFTVPFTVNNGSNGQITDTLTVSSSTDPRGNQSKTVGLGSDSSYIAVQYTHTPTQVVIGNNAVFNAVVENTGQSPATNITVTYALSGPAGTVATVTCTAAAGIQCPPAPLGQSVVIPQLDVGRAVTFQYTVSTTGLTTGAGAIINTVTASAAGNSDTTQTSATAAIQPISSNNGTYLVFAANGNQYSLVINFDAGSYTMTGNGANIQEFFSADSTNGYTVSGTERFRVATDLIVGGQNFGAGVVPYIAARVFGSTVNQLSGTSGGAYDLVTLSIPSGGPTATTAGTARVSGNTLAICQSTTGVVTPQDCASLPTGSLQSYSLNVDGNQYTAVNTTTQQQFTFQEALIGASAALLWAGTEQDGVTPEFVIGLPDASILAGGSPLLGPTTSGDWITEALTSTSYSYTSQLGTADSAPLARINTNGGPFSMLQGNLVSNGAQIYVMQAVPLAVEFGAPGGAASGQLQVTLP